MGWATLVHKVRRNAEDHGWQIAFRKVVRAISAPLYAHTAYRIYKLDVQRSAVRESPSSDGVVLKLLDSEDTRLIAAIERYAEWLQSRLAGIIAEGALCVVATRSDELVGFNLVRFGEVQITPLRLTRQFHAGNAWSEHIMVAESCRARGLATRLRQRMIAELARRGMRRLYGGAEPWNTPSLNLARRLGFQEFAVIHLQQLMGVKTWSVQRVRRHVDTRR